MQPASASEYFERTRCGDCAAAMPGAQPMSVAGSASSPFAQLMAQTGAAFERCLLGHPLVADLRAGKVGLAQYAAYLRETWHLVRHTTAIFSLAASRVGEERWPLKEWLLQQACEEHGHERLCLADLGRLGLDAAAIADSRPGPGAWGLVTQDYYYAAAGDPLCLLGTASLSEQLGASVAAPVLQALEQANGIPRAGTGFIRAHGTLDGGHLGHVQDLLDRLAVPADLPMLVDARLRAIGFSAQLLDDVRAARA